MRASAAPESRYRSDVQGLRAVAVLAVLAFHARLPFPGGFTGVDVFFVISGFVITGLLLRGRGTRGHWNLRTFFVQRFRRLFPALVVVVAFTVLAALVVFLPFGRQQITEITALGAILFVSNFVIVRITGGYFDAPASFNPLLNTWSLSVEAQIYVVFPLMLALAWGASGWSSRLRNRIFGTVLFISSLSFILASLYPLLPSLFITEATVGFFGPVGRMWEFGVGAMTYLLLQLGFELKTRTATLLAGAGVVGLAFSFLRLDETLVFPGPWTVIPVFSTAALIFAGASRRNLISRMLGSRPAVFVGDRSYSLYLWHWPFVVFAGSLFPSSRLPLVVATALSLVPAAISYRYVERPIHRGKVPLAISTRRLASLVPLSLGLVLVAFGLSNSVLKHSMSGAYVGKVIGESDSSFSGEDGLEQEYPCLFDPIRLQDPALFDYSCFQSKESPATVAVFGDSHAAHLREGLVANYPETSFAFVGGHPGKENFLPNAQAIAASSDVKTVIMSAQWVAYDLDELSDAFLLFDSTQKETLILDDVPTFAISADTCKYPPLVVLPPRCSDSKPFDRYNSYVEILEDASSDWNSVTLVPTFRHFCDEYSCSMVNENRILFHDSSHLNEQGSKYLVKKIREDFPSFLGKS